MYRKMSRLSRLFTWPWMLVGSCILFASCGNCPDYPIEPDVVRFLPYQANQLVVFEDAAQNLDTLTVSSYYRGFDTETCTNNSNQTFEYERILLTLGTIAGDSLYVLFENTTPEKLSMRFMDNIGTRGFDPLTGTVDGGTINNNYETFAFQATEVVNGTTYQKVSTYSLTSYNDSRMETVKLAIDFGVVAYKTDGGVWWYLH